MEGPRAILLQAHVDCIVVFRNAIFVDGWSNVPSTEVHLRIAEKHFTATRRVVERGDLTSLYGKAAWQWGFSAVFVVDDYETAVRVSDAEISVPGLKKVLATGMGRHARELANADHATLTERYFEAIGDGSGKRVLEIGSRARSGITRRQMFRNCLYVGLDVLEGPNVDIVGDAHELSSLVSDRFDFVYSVSVFEHLLMPWKVVSELSKVMAPGGLVYIQTHQMWPIHDAPWDFWRFSKDSWPALFNAATGFEILGAAYFDPMHLTPACETGNSATWFGNQVGYGGVSVLARATGKHSRLSWDVSLKEVIGTAYPQ
jgi:SAM-dependent methyltransferase